MINVSLKTKAKEVDGNYVLDGITIGRVTDLKPNEWFGKVMLSNVGEEYAEYGLLDPMAIVEGDDGVTYKDPKGGSDGSRGTLLEPDGTPSVNVSSFDNDEDFFKALGESKSKEHWSDDSGEELPDERSESELDTDTSWEDSLYGDPAYPSSDSRNWYKKGGQWKVIGDDPNDMDELTGESRANEDIITQSNGERMFECPTCGV